MKTKEIPDNPQPAPNRTSYFRTYLDRFKQGMMSGERQVNWGFGLALCCLAVAGLFTYQSTSQVAGSSRLVAHSRHVLGTIAELRSYLAEAQSASRGYQLTGGTNRIADYRKASNGVRQELDQLRRLTSDNPVQLKTLASLTPLITDRLNQLSEAVFSNPNRTRTVTQRAAEVELTSDLIPKISEKLQEAENQEQSLLQVRTAALDASIQRAHLFVAFASLLAFALVGTSLISLNRDFRVRWHTMQALRREKEFSSSLIKSSVDGILAYDHECRFTEWNPGMERISGLGKDAVLGQCAFDAFPFLKQTGVDKLLLDSLKGKTCVASDQPYVIPQNGKEGFFEGYYSPLRNESGEIVGGLGIIREITARKLAAKDLEVRMRQRAALADLGESALSGIELGPLMEKAVALVAETLDVQYVKILELLPDGRVLLLRAGVGWKEGCVGETKVSSGLESQAGFTLRCREPVIVEDFRTETRFHGPPLLLEHGIVSGMSTVVAGPERPYGVLGAHTKTYRPFSKDDAHFLQAVANVLAFAIDRKRTEKTLQESEERFRQIAENIQEVFWMSDSTGSHTLYVNPAYESVWGHPARDLLQHPFSWQESIHPEDRERVARAYREQTEKGTFESEFRIVRPDKSIRWIWDRGFPVRNAAGQVQRIVGVAMDITDYKQAEESLRRLSSELLRAQDEERRRIARELHDSTGQYLTALSMNLARVRGAAESLDLKTQELLTESFDLVKRSIQEIRTLSYLLHPPLLEEFGLISALQWYTQGFEKRSGIHTQLDLPDDLGRMPQEIELAMFRVVQESLTNVHRHSGSPSARIRISRHNEEVKLEVADHGRGMPANLGRPGNHTPRSGVGISGMRERVKELGGRLNISSGNKGTSVTVVIPLGERHLRRSTHA